MDKANEVMKIVEWYLNGQGACFIFRTAECTFSIAVSFNPQSPWTTCLCDNKVVFVSVVSQQK